MFQTSVLMCFLFLFHSTSDSSKFSVYRLTITVWMKKGWTAVDQDLIWNTVNVAKENGLFLYLWL